MIRVLAGLVLLTFLAGEKNPDEVRLSADEKALLELVNRERRKEKVPALTIQPALCRAAQGHAENMAKQEKLSHQLDGKGVGDRVSETGYDWRSVGENLAMAPAEKDGEDPPPPAPADIHKMWMESKGHRANIVNGKYTQIGLATARSKKGTYFYVQVFATPRR